MMVGRTSVIVPLVLMLLGCVSVAEAAEHIGDDGVHVPVAERNYERVRHFKDPEHPTEAEKEHLQQRHANMRAHQEHQVEHAKRSDEKPHLGYNHEINWQNDWEQTLDLARSQGKPIMAFLVSVICTPCDLLRPAFFHKEVIELTDKFIPFISHNFEGTEFPAVLTPDGAYTPRVVFLDKFGNLLDVHNENRNYASYKHYYATRNQLLESMKWALDPNVGAHDEL